MTGTGDAGYMVPPNEQAALLAVFSEMLSAPTGDGKKKRAAGLKQPWWRDLGHEAAFFSHLWKWKRGDRIDHDSGVHPLVHLAWRALALAYIETHGMTDPEKRPSADATGHP